MEQNTEIISLTKENYTQHLPITPVAFSVAEGGAMGSPGQVIIIDEKLNVYDFWLHEMEKGCAREIIPTLYECHWGGWNNIIPAFGWNYVDLGFGNHLMVIDSIYEKFSEIANGRCKSKGELYQQWISIVKEILHSKQL